MTPANGKVEVCFNFQVRERQRMRGGLFFLFVNDQPDVTGEAVQYQSVSSRPRDVIRESAIAAS